MAKIISFGWVWPAIVAKRKTVTRRQWDHAYAAQFHQGDVVLAYDRSPRVYGRPIARLRLTADPVLEHMSRMPDEDYEGEGFAFMEAHRDLIPKSSPLRKTPALTLKDYFDLWRQEDAHYWVVRFAIVEILPGVKLPEPQGSILVDYLHGEALQEQLL